MPVSSSQNSWRASPWAFFLAVFTWTWGFWLADIATGLGTETIAGLALALAGLLGPMIGGIAFTYLSYDGAGRRDYWRRLADVRRIPARGLAITVLLTPALMGVAVGADLLTGGDLSAYRETVAPFAEDPMRLLPFALLVLVVGPLPEEFGWRGYVLDRLLERRGPLASGLILGIVWGLWHLPLFFMEGTYQYEQGVFTLWFWTFMAGIVPLSVVMTRIYLGTNRSTLAIILFHFMVVFTDDFLNATPGANVISTILWAALAIALDWRFRQAQS